MNTLSPPILLYNKLKRNDDEIKKEPTNLQQSGQVGGGGIGLVIMIIIFVALYYYCFKKYRQRGRIMEAGGVPRGTGRSILTILNILFNPFAYALYSLMELYIPYISAVHKDAYQKVMKST